MNGIFCTNSVYEFGGWRFEYHVYTGPWPLRKDGELRARAGRKFYSMWERFSNLTTAEQRKCRVRKGGCYRL